MSYVIRNYGPSRQVPFGNQQICIERDCAIVTDDLDEVAAFTGQPNISITEQPNTIKLVPPVEAPPKSYQEMNKRELLALATEREGIEIPEKVTKKELIVLLLAWDEAEANPPDERDDEEEESSEPEVPATDDGYDTMKMRELKVLMKKQKLSMPQNASKVQLVGLLRE